jgi:hypothetical protein
MDTTNPQTEDSSLPPAAVATPAPVPTIGPPQRVILPPGTKLPISDSALELALRECGAVAADATVTVHSKEELFGGFNSQVLKFHIEPIIIKSINCGEPLEAEVVPIASIIVKICTKMPGNYSFANEQLFYANASKHLPCISPTSVSFRVPAVYCIKEMGKHFVFVLEDLGDGGKFTKLPQQLGCNLEQAQLIAVALARFHAHNWVEDPSTEAENTLQSRCPYALDDKLLAIFANMMTGNAEEFIEHFKDNLILVPEGLQSRLQHLVSICVDKFTTCVQALRTKNVTLLHGDARAANYFLETGAHGITVVAIDWQGFNIGSGPAELAYFLSMSVQSKVLRDHEQLLLRLYFDTLITCSGTTSLSTLSFDTFYRSYLLGLAVCLSVPFLTRRLVKDGKKYAAKPTTAPHMQSIMQTALRAYADIGPMLDRWVYLCLHMHVSEIEQVLNEL